MSAEPVRFETAEGVLRITLDRPEQKNSLTPASVRAMIGALEAAATDESLRAVLVTASGADFCAGADVVAANAERQERPRTGSLQRRTALEAHRLVEVVVSVQLPVVCAVRGFAAGLGCQLALAADFAIASEDATFWEPFVARGFTPDSGASWLLPRLVGVARAKELLMLGERWSGREAADRGLIHRAVADAELGPAAETLVHRLARGPTVAIGLAKRCIQRGLAGSLADAMEQEALALELSSRSVDFREGIAAFRERRKPEFEGR